MGCVKDLLITVYGGGDDAVVAAEKLAGLNRWIPVGERLPDDRQHVIACFPSPLEFMTHAVYEKDPGWFSIPNYGAAQATHWMPFPDPPTDAK